MPLSKTSLSFDAPPVCFEMKSHKKGKKLRPAIFQFSRVIQTSWYSGTPLTPSPMGQKKNGCDIEVIVLTRISLQENVWSFLPGG